MSKMHFAYTFHDSANLEGKGCWMEKITTSVHVSVTSNPKQ